MSHRCYVFDVLGFVGSKCVCSSKMYLLRALGTTAVVYELQCWTNEIEVILDQVAFEGFQGQCAISHSQNKLVVHELVPHRSDVRMS